MRVLRHVKTIVLHDAAGMERRAKEVRRLSSPYDINTSTTTFTTTTPYSVHTPVVVVVMVVEVVTLCAVVTPDSITQREYRLPAMWCTA